jgi:hypothetical protein
MPRSLIFFFLIHTLSAQIPVHQEPFHQPVYEAPGLMRLLDIRTQAGDTTAFHLHENDLFFVTLDSARVFLEDEAQGSRTVELPKGYFNSYTSYREMPYVHRFANIGQGAYRTLGIEHLGPLTARGLPKLPKQAEWVMENERFGVAKGILVKDGSLKWENPLPGFLLSLKGSPLGIETNTGIKTYLLDQGDWYVLKEGEKYRVFQEGEEEAVFLLVFLR